MAKLLLAYRWDWTFWRNNNAEMVLYNAKMDIINKIKIWILAGTPLFIFKSLHIYVFIRASMSIENILVILQYVMECYFLYAYSLKFEVYT